MADRKLLLGGAVLAGIAVALGAFGAHGLRTILQPEQLDWWRTGTDYLMWHGVALVALAGIEVPLRRGGALLGLGALLFSLSLYLMALTGWRWPGIVTPFGGLMMLAGWFWIARASYRSRP